MKIALNVESIDPSSGGVERYVYNLATYLIKNGHEIHIISRVPFPLPGCHFHPTGRIRWSKLADIIYFALVSKTILRKNGFDIIHGFGRTLYQDVYRIGGGCHHIYYLQSLKTLRPGFLKWFRAMERRIRPRNLLTRYIERRLYRGRRYKKIVAVSRWVESQLWDQHMIPSEAISVIYNGVDLERFHPCHKEGHGRGLREKLGLKKARVFLFVSNNYLLKGLSFLIQALGILNTHRPKMPVALLVVGKDRPGPFRNLARALGVGKQTFFIGAIREGLEHWYGAADCLVHPTLYDPFSNVCLEALASGLPVITSRFNGASEIITENVAGKIISDPTSPEEIAAGMETFIDDDLLHESSRQARTLAESYSLDRNLNAVMEVYNDVLQQKRKNPG